jgi:hypothetical protein
MLRNFLLAGLETRLARPGTAVDGYQVVGGILHISRVETDRGGISFTAQDSPNREGLVFEFSGQRRRSALSSIEMVNIGNALEYRVGRIRTSNIRSPSFFDKPANTQLDHRFRPHVQPEILVRQAETGHLFVRPKLNGKDRGWFLFDSGAGFTGLNAKIAREEGFDLVGQVDQGGFGGKPISVEVYKGGSLELGPLIVDELFFQDVGEMTRASKILGEPVTGVLGWDILTRAAVEVDLRDGRLFIHDPRSYRIDPEHRAPLFLHWQVPYAEGRASGDLNGPFMLDTGAGSRGLVFPHYSVKRYGLLKGQIGKRQTSEGARGKMAMLAGELDWFEIGGHRTSPAPARFSLAEDFEADFYAIGILGGAVLEPFRLVLDYSRGEVGFVPRD